jgi:L-alanine-DL-glutamate epimerase-like enolase superfamily enzyme
MPARSGELRIDADRTSPKMTVCSRRDGVVSRVAPPTAAGFAPAGYEHMRIVDIRETAVPLRSQLKNAIFDFSEMTTSVVAVITDVVREGRPVVGFAFNSTGRYACGAQMRERFIPRILRVDPETLVDERGDNLDPAKILAAMRHREKIGGDAERSIGIGTIEVAVWDAVAKIAGKPLYRVLAERFNDAEVPARVFCYVGGGWYFPGQTMADLQDEMRRHLDAGYTLVKMKVGGMPVDDDCRRIEAVLKVLGGEHRLAVDANGKFDRDEGLVYAGALKRFGLAWFEEPCHPLDYALYAEIANAYAAPIGGGENLYSIQDAVNLARFGGLKAGRDFLQVDPTQCYGYGEYVRMLDTLKTLGWPRTSFYPHGGNQMSLAAAAGLGLAGTESYPGVFGVFAGFADDAKVEGGMMTLSDRPGIGFEGQAALYAVMKELSA